MAYETNRKSRVDDEKNHYNQNEKQNDNSANLAHIVSFQQFTQLFLNKIELLRRSINLSIEFLDQSTLFINLSTDLLTLEFESACDFVNFVQVLVLLLDQLYFHLVHFWLFVIIRLVFEL
jgi:hypothetical protein